MNGLNTNDLFPSTDTKFKFKDFPIGTDVKIVTTCQDFNFFYGETGKVIKNTGEYLGISVEYDIPRKYQDGRIEKTFNFAPTDLKPIRTGCLSMKEADETMANVFKYLDTVDIKPYIEKFKGQDVHEMMEKLEEDYPFKDDYSETLFDATSADEFIDYLNGRYDLNIQESVEINYYL